MRCNGVSKIVIEGFVIIMMLISVFLLWSDPSKAQCVISDNRPDPKCTPGATFTALTSTQACVPLYTAKVRNVTTAIKKQVFAEYAMNNKKSPCPCEIDHFISLELGGSNDIKNLWPEPYQDPMGARIKDKVEDYLHRQVCQGNMTLLEAQKVITTNWKTAYEGMHTK